MQFNPVTWFEIPVNDMERAKAFYEAVFQFEIQLVDFGGLKMGWFPNAGSVSGATGSLMQHESYVPSHSGTLVYFSCQDVANELSRVEAAGGKVMHNKTQISPEHGFMAVFEDSEGNRIALHSLE